MPVEKPQTKAEKTTHTTVDTICFSVKDAHRWEVPTDIQRGIKVNKKVMELAIQIKNDGGVIPGILTLGILDGHTYLIDGLQRREAFFISEHLYGYADVRTCYFKTRAEMGEEFVRLNSQLVKMTPDDILRGLEAAVPLLAAIRKARPWVGYGRVRITGSSSRAALLLSMSVCLRCWQASRHETPRSSASGLQLARELQADEVEKLILFLGCVYDAWGVEESSWRLWGAANLTIVMWMFRRLVVQPDHSPYSRVKPISLELFRKCCMSLSADRSYLDWLVGRQLCERDRAPGYNRIKAIFTRRIFDETHKKQTFPQPEWAH